MRYASRETRRSRRGFALLAVLLVMTAAVALGAALASRSNAAIAAARNRVALTTASWRAEGCVERARAVIGDALQEDATGRTWRQLDSIVAGVALGAECDVTVRPSGLRLDANEATHEQLRVLFQGSGVVKDRADSLADAVIDWRDADDEPQPHGAERAWYEAARRLPPKNGAFSSEAELSLVRGVADVPGIDTLVGVDRARIWVDRAPLAVLATLPGFTAEAISQIRARREIGRSIGELAAFADGLSPGARDAVLAHYAELSRLTTLIPESWTITALAASGSPEAVVRIEVRVARAGTRAAIVRRRSWP